MNNERRLILDHDFYCTSCGNKGIPVSRDKRKIRENGHLKKLFCLKCQREVNHAEVSSYGTYNREMFIDEYNSGNFDSEGNRIIPLKEWKILFYGTDEWESEESQIEEINDVNEWLEIFQLSDKEIA